MGDVPDAEVTLPSATSSVPTARRFVESVLLGWGLDRLSWDAAMIVSELTSNVALHAGGSTFTVRVSSRPDGSVRLEVSDGSLRLPQQRTHSATATTGRGLRIVSDLADDWGAAAGLGGKTVWVELGGQASRTAAESDVELDLDQGLADLDSHDEDLPGPAPSARNPDLRRTSPLPHAA